MFVDLRHQALDFSVQTSRALFLPYAIPYRGESRSVRVNVGRAREGRHRGVQLVIPQ